MDSSLLYYNIFQQYSGEVQAFSTTTDTIRGELEPRYTGTPAEKAMENRSRLAAVLNLDARQLVFPRQTHTCHVGIVNGIPEKELSETDALVTNQPGICLCIQTADCVPLLMFDPKVKAVGAVHAGWRGTVMLIASKTVARFTNAFGSNPEDIHVAIGPFIGPDVYEVGDEVARAVNQNIPHASETLRMGPAGKYHLDLGEANKQVLLSCGVLPQNIQNMARCTFTESSLFFSARRNGIATGRIVSGIMLKHNFRL